MLVLVGVACSCVCGCVVGSEMSSISVLLVTVGFGCIVHIGAYCLSLTVQVETPISSKPIDNCSNVCIKKNSTMLL